MPPATPPRPGHCATGRPEGGREGGRWPGERLSVSGERRERETRREGGVERTEALP